MGWGNIYKHPAKSVCHLFLKSKLSNRFASQLVFPPIFSTFNPLNFGLTPSWSLARLGQHGLHRDTQVQGAGLSHRLCWRNHIWVQEPCIPEAWDYWLLVSIHPPNFQQSHFTCVLNCLLIIVNQPIFQNNNCVVCFLNFLFINPLFHKTISSPYDSTSILGPKINTANQFSRDCQVYLTLRRNAERVLLWWRLNFRVGGHLFSKSPGKFEVEVTHLYLEMTINMAAKACMFARLDMSKVLK